MPLFPSMRTVPPCPDPERYILVQTKEGTFWRLKRGLKTPVVVNSALAANVQLMKTCSPAAKRLLTAVAPNTKGLDTGRIHSRFVSLFRKGLKGNHFSYAPFQHIDFQPKLPLNRLLKTNVTITQPGYSLVVQVPIKPGNVERLSSSLSDFYLEAILVCGDPLSGAPLKVRTTASPLYTYDNIPSTTSVLHLPLEGKPWLLLLKFCSREGNQLAADPRYYGLQVIEVGS